MIIALMGLKVMVRVRVEMWSVRPQSSVNDSFLVLLWLLFCLSQLYLFTANGSVRSSPSSDTSSNQSTARGESASSHESVSVTDWTTSHVADWLQRISLQRYVDLFTAQNVNGRMLLQLDSTKMKVFRHMRTS